MKKMISTCILIAIMVTLPGCITGIMVSAAVATKVITDPRTFGTQVDDTTVEIRVNNALDADQQIQKNTHIVTTVYQGKVLLTGQVPDMTLAERAQNIITNIHGVREVYNELRIKNQVHSRTVSSDLWITAKVRSQLLYNEQVRSSHIKIHTENSEVFLLGIVTNIEAVISAEIASRVSGVRHVTTVFTILKE
ncbi:division/outer membrane stress-associated lipid-binding lipoprotein [Candidatus Erwinia haradaeae]|uniref:Uncharacterized protein YraP n=1 Tax=Candidatus Erwinia haradaeae TaxID=1922217 RepID=A0A451DA41_9GAMM|nr:division/outer membrane stress-associated lipid-binding lipoprotein [Candidatus Erwinia haradaeae]VFP83217.1 Uncharacterized protein YraP [Candidatus Erwinia haradaeae]